MKHEEVGLPLSAGSRRFYPSLGLAVLLAGCAATDASVTIRDLPPAPLVVVVEPAEPCPDAAEASDMRFAATEAEMQQMIADELRRLNASSRVVTRAELGDSPHDVTLTFLPKGPIEFRHEGTASLLGAGGLWLVTWIGGLLVPDSRYVVTMDASCRFAIGAQGFERPVLGGEVDLSFFERNDLFSFPGLQSLILPPFWTTDQPDKTSSALTLAAMRLAARQIAQMLKNEYEQAAGNEFLCSVQVSTPKNGQPVTGTSMPIELVVLARTSEPVSSVSVRVNDGPESALQLESRGLSVVAKGTLAGLRTEQDNWIRVNVTSDRTYSRTLRLGRQQP